MRNLAVFLYLLLTYTLVTAQEEVRSVKGVVLTQDKKGKLEGIPFANVYWMDTNYGTSTSIEGTFQLAVPDKPTLLIASFVGYTSDTIDVKDFNAPISFVLSESVLLDEVEITYRRKATEVSFMNPMKMENISEKELFKAACCNLSESFETNPSVDVNFTDAVTGAKQIRMLGLDGPYTMISRENMPGIRGIGNSYGLSFIPGTWINSIQVTKGVGSVVNGYESIAGQINTELQQPDHGEQLFLNAYASQEGRMELNFVNTHQVNSKWGTTLLLHGSMNPWEQDVNKDGFMDMPKQQQINLMNRWDYHNGTEWEAQFGIQFLKDEKEGGQIKSWREESHNPYSIGINTERAEFFAKVGYIFPEYKYRSMGLQLLGLHHRHESKYGNREYNATEQTAYANYIYQSIIDNTMHKFKTGMSFMYDTYDEQVDTLGSFKRVESVPGTFFEYTYEPSSVFTLVAGVRVDYHNLYGLFYTPRLHMRIAPTETTVLRLLGGSGQRTSNVFAEHQSLFATSRTIELFGQNKGAYGLLAERAYNAGLSIMQDFRLDYRDGYVTVDMYRTNFTNKVVVDIDEASDRALIYNLDGKSYANSAQLEVNYELIKFLDLRLAYRWMDVKTQYKSGLKRNPLTPKHRLFANLGYETKQVLGKGNWTFDFTAQWLGEQRIPTTAASPVEHQRASNSSSFTLFNTQVTRNFNDRWSGYIGLENIFNYTQKNPIIEAENPFGNHFDASLVWGPIYGRMVYVGFRFRIQKEE